jgi:hypothetical protein
MRAAWKKDYSTGDTERCVKEGFEMGICFHKSPSFGEYGGTLIS